MIVQGVKSKQKSFEKYLKEKATQYHRAYMKVFKEEIQKILEEVSITGPADTGASSGEASRAKTSPIPVWHPAFGMNIGHAIGDSGWQILEKDNGYVLINPMWDNYLKYIELGVVPGAGQYTHFVQRAWDHHIRSRATFRKAQLG